MQHHGRSWTRSKDAPSLVLGSCPGPGEAGRKPEGVALEQSIRKCLRQIYKAHWHALAMRHTAAHFHSMAFEVRV